MDNKIDIRKERKVRARRARRFLFAPYVFISPFFILFLIFAAFPIGYSLYLSFYSWNGIREMRFVGLDNYVFILTHDYLFWKSLGNTFLMMIITGIPQHTGALFVAFILNQGLVKLKNFFRGVLFIPYITSTAAITIIFSIVFGIQYGFFNHMLLMLKNLGFLELFFQVSLPIEFMRGSMTWFTISFVIFWKWLGWNAIIYLAGLQAISSEIYDAAKIDGASWFQIFIRVTIPMLKPVIYFATSLTIIYGMQLFDEPMIWMGIAGLDATGNWGLTTAVYMYGYAFSYGKFGVSTAISYMLCLIILILSNVYRKIMDEK